MEILAEIEGDWEAALAALAWQIELGVADAVGDIPVDRYALSDGPPRRQPTPTTTTATTVTVDAATVAADISTRCDTLDALREAIQGFDLCDLKRGAKNTVFADGNPSARVLILGEAPGRDEDIEGRPFVGRAGQLLDKMFAAIGLSRTSPDAESALYITNVLPWRPPGNREPDPDEIVMMRPFVERHIALAAPDVIVIMGNTPLLALMGHRGILRARGHWTKALGKPVLPMTHPAYLLRNPVMKRGAWSDLLSLKAQLESRGGG